MQYQANDPLDPAGINRCVARSDPLRNPRKHDRVFPRQKVRRGVFCSDSTVRISHSTMHSAGQRRASSCAELSWSTELTSRPNSHSPCSSTCPTFFGRHFPFFPQTLLSDVLLRDEPPVHPPGLGMCMAMR